MELKQVHWSVGRIQLPRRWLVTRAPPQHVLLRTLPCHDCHPIPTDIEWAQGPNPIPIDPTQQTTFALYFFKQKKLTILTNPADQIQITLDPFNFELVTVSPVTQLAKKSVQFAPIGLVNMLNTGGAVQSFVVNEEGSLVQVGVKGCGEMRAFASEKPRRCRINGEEVGIGYEEEGTVVVQVPWVESSGVSIVEYLF